MRKSIYLHFLDREMREESSDILSEKDYEIIICIALFMSPLIYSSLTHELECERDLPKTCKLLKKLNELGVIIPITSKYSADELALSHQSLYTYDKYRHTLYSSGEDKVFFPSTVLVIDGSTTRYIENDLLQNNYFEYDFSHCDSSQDLLNFIITKRIQEFSEEGLTIKSFESAIDYAKGKGVSSLQASAARRKLNRKLIYLHNKKHMSDTNSTIIRNIPHCEAFDELDINSKYDYLIYKSILMPIFYRQSIEKNIDRIVGWKNNVLFQEFCTQLYDYVVNLISNYTSQFPHISYRIIVREIVVKIEDAKRLLKVNRLNYLTIEDLLFYLFALRKKTIANNMIYGGNDRMNILIMVANMNEFEGVLAEANSIGFSLNRTVIGSNTFYVYVGKDYSLYIVKSESGALGSGSSLITLTEAISNIDIDTIIFSGIAFGNYKKKEKEQNIGDILVSKQIWNYESGKASETFIFRGDKTSATPWLVDRFENSALSWKESRIHFGLIASGEKLSNSEPFLEGLLSHEPEMIGGEMEGTGLIAVAERFKKSWILVKGISDWGVNKTDNDQLEVAKKTFRFVFLTIKEYFL